MKTVAITGIGWVTAAGMGNASQGNDFRMPAGELFVPETLPESIFKKPFPYFRRMDAYSRLGLVAVALALKDANLDEWTEKRDIGIIVSSQNGCVHTDMEYFKTVLAQNGIGASPALFSYTLPSVFLGEAAICFGLTGATLVVSSTARPGQTALVTGLESLAGGETEKMLCGICDLNAPVLTGVDLDGPPGAVFLVLESHPGKNSSSYGSICLDLQNRILFDGAEIRDILELVQKCLANRRQHY